MSGHYIITDFTFDSKNIHLFNIMCKIKCLDHRSVWLGDFLLTHRPLHRSSLPGQSQWASWWSNWTSWISTLRRLWVQTPPPLAHLAQRARHRWVRWRVLSHMDILYMLRIYHQAACRSAAALCTVHIPVKHMLHACSCLIFQNQFTLLWG